MTPVSMAILAGGGIAAVADGLLACIFWGVARGASPERVFQGVASGLIGREAAIAGGLPTAILGVVLHTIIAVGMAATFVLVAQRVPVLLRWPWLLVGVVYGVLLMGAMRYVVVPISRATQGPDWWPWTVAELFSHLVLVGLPIVWAARHWLVAEPVGAVGVLATR
jgi:uncharacterized membrane protein YagU involved in acid resistance